MPIKKIILITGPSGSGKGTAARYLHEKYGAILYSFSSPLHALLSDMGLANTRENLDTLSRSLRENFGQDIMGRGVREYIQKHEGNMIVLEGIRRVATMQEFRELIDTVIWVDAPFDTRYTRISNRGEKDGETNISREQFEAHESLESNKSIDEFRELADVIIDNNGTEEELYKKIDTTLGTLS